MRLGWSFNRRHNRSRQTEFIYELLCNTRIYRQKTSPHAEEVRGICQQKLCPPLREREVLRGGIDIFLT